MCYLSSRRFLIFFLSALIVVLAFGERGTLAARFASPDGTSATMEVLPQRGVEAVTPANVTVLLPFVPPKFSPVMVTDMPDGPDVEINENRTNDLTLARRCSQMPLNRLQSGRK